MTKQRLIRRIGRDGRIRQILQEKKWWGWKTIDHELVPEHVLDSIYCSGGAIQWKSKFTGIPGVWPKENT